MVDEADENTEVPAPPKKSKLPLILATLVVFAGAGGAGWYFTLGPGGGSDAGDGDEAQAKASEKHGEPLYFTLADNLVVNFRSPGGTRFLQVGIDLMTYDEKGLLALQKHAPVLRSDLILLLSDQAQETLLSRDGKEALRSEALAEVRSNMKELSGEPVVESVYFTSFVMQ